eukprot:361821-Chlamydomonas_euryale.AAC.6
MPPHRPPSHTSTARAPASPPQPPAPPPAAQLTRQCHGDARAVAAGCRGRRRRWAQGVASAGAHARMAAQLCATASAERGSNEGMHACARHGFCVRQAKQRGGSARVRPLHGDAMCATASAHMVGTHAWFGNTFV